jgi:hypothetical protein
MASLKPRTHAFTAHMVMMCMMASRTLQVIGTHNSYHVAPNPAIIQLLSSPEIQALTANKTPPAYVPQAWEYTHPPLTAQLNAGGSCPYIPEIEAF